MADRAFASVSVGHSFNLRSELRNEARRANVHVWIRSDGRQFTVAEAWTILTETEWTNFDTAAKLLFSSIWLRKMEAARRVSFD